MDAVSKLDEQKRIDSIRNYKMYKRRYRDLLVKASFLSECPECGEWSIEIDTEAQVIRCSCCSEVRELI